MKIAVIGGGPGGLFTARYLLKKTTRPLEICIFEATNRLGGKVLTNKFSTGSIYEAGVAELYKLPIKDDPLYRLFVDLGFKFSKMERGPTVMNDTFIYGNEDLPRICGDACYRAVQQFEELGKSLRSPQQYVGAGWPADNNHPWAKLTFEEVLARYVPSEKARRFIEIDIKSDLATEIGLSSGRFGFDNYLVDEPSYCNLYTLRGGIEQFIGALHREIADRTSIHLNTMAKRIRKNKNGKYHLLLQKNENYLADDFDAVFICLPQHWLKSILYGGELARVMDKHSSYYAHPGHYLKVAIHFENKFWAEQFADTAYIKLDAFGGCCVYDESYRYSYGKTGCLNWLLGGSNAEAMSNYSDNLLVRRMIESLPHELARKGRKLILEASVHRWVGTVNGEPGGKHIVDLVEKHVPSPKSYPEIHVVGDYLFDSTLNGLLDSADISTSLFLEKTNLLDSDYSDDLNYHHQQSYRKNPSSNLLKVSSKVARLMRRT